MTGGLSTQVKMNVKPIGAFKSGLIRQVVFECRGLKIQGPLYMLVHVKLMQRFKCSYDIIINDIIEKCFPLSQKHD